MKLNRIIKNARYAAGYDCSYRKFKKLVRSSPDCNINRVAARKLKQVWLHAKHEYVPQLAESYYQLTNNLRK